jgi:uncharacterized protein
MNTTILTLVLSLLFCFPSFSAGRKPLGVGEMYWLLDRAIAQGDELSVQFLLEAGADPSGPRGYAAFQKKYQKPFEPMWHLCQAAYGGRAGVTRLLLKAGADPNLAYGEGVTALTIAAERGYIEMVRLLLDAGADKNYKTSRGTAVDLALRNKHDDLAELIRRHK